MSDNSNNSKADQVYEILKEKIINHELKPLEPLSERKISTMLNVSRTPVNVALRKLQLDRFIKHTPDFGSYVAPVTYELIQEIYEIREVLEGLSARLCAQSLTEADREYLIQAYGKLKAALEDSRFDEAIEYDINFHRFIITHCRNHMLKDMVHTVFEHSQRITKLIDYTSIWSETVQKQHKDVYQAILDGNAEEAERNMRIHISSSKNRQLAQITR